jgi:phage terminase large subunit-like protein
MKIEKSRAYQYAQWCLKRGNKQVPHYVKLQCKQWIDIADGNSDIAYVDIDEFDKIHKIDQCTIHPDLMLPMSECRDLYAELFIVAIMCTKVKDDPRNLRYYQKALLEISRKNHKTFNAADIMIKLMLTNKQFGRYFSVAPDQKLSKEIQLAMRKIIKSSPDLLEIFRTLRSEIRCNPKDATFTALAYSQDKLDGKTADCFLADEVGAMDSYPVEAMSSSQIGLPNKLGIITSTQYPNDNNSLLDEIDIAKKNLDGLLPDDQREFALLFEPDEELTTGDTWQKDDNCIYQSNPFAVENEEVFNDLKNKRTMAVLYENKRENYLCKHNNIMYKGLGTEGYVDISKVKKCSRAKNKNWWKGKKVFIGVDLSQTDDNTAVAMSCMEDGVIYAKVMGFLPEGKIEFKSQKEKVDYKRLIDKGDCIPCGDEVINYGTVEDYVMGLEKSFGVEVMQIGYDRYNAISSINKFEENQMECVEIKQHSSVLHSPTKLLKEKIEQGLFRYDENILLEINFSNSRCTEDTNLNKYVNKKKSSGKVDMVVALINSIYLVEQNDLFGMDFIVQTA